MAWGSTDMAATLHLRQSQSSDLMHRWLRRGHLLLLGLIALIAIAIALFASLLLLFVLLVRGIKTVIAQHVGSIRQ